MWDRTITVNSFSKSWNISGWRLGYAYGKGELVAPINGAATLLVLEERPSLFLES
jgi:aspartate/methionine/tyrosine aminotransferase